MDKNSLNYNLEKFDYQWQKQGLSIGKKGLEFKLYIKKKLKHNKRAEIPWEWARTQSVRPSYKNQYFNFRWCIPDLKFLNHKFVWNHCNYFIAKKIKNKEYI